MIGIFCLVAGAIGWKIADTMLAKRSNIPASIESSPIVEIENSPVFETTLSSNTELGQKQDAITDATPAELVLMLKIIFPAVENQIETAIIQHRDKQANAFANREIHPTNQFNSLNKYFTQYCRSDFRFSRIKSESLIS